MATDAAESITVRLTLSEALTVLAAVRQYEPFWSPNCAGETLAKKLLAQREEVDAVIAKIRQAADDR
jgi:hypothetical protein